MGTHPIFESDFDCLTEEIGCIIEFPLNLNQNQANQGAVSSESSWSSASAECLPPPLTRLTRSSDRIVENNGKWTLTVFQASSLRIIVRGAGLASMRFCSFPSTS